MNIQYNKRVFRFSDQSTLEGFHSDSLFFFNQEKENFWGYYRDEENHTGSLLGHVLKDRDLSFFFVDLKDNRRKKGRCYLNPALLPDGRLRLSGEWTWIDEKENRKEIKIDLIEIPSELYDAVTKEHPFVPYLEVEQQIPREFTP